MPEKAWKIKNYVVTGASLGALIGGVGSPVLYAISVGHTEAVFFVAIIGAVPGAIVGAFQGLIFLIARSVYQTHIKRGTDANSAVNGVTLKNAASGVIDSLMGKLLGIRNIQNPRKRGLVMALVGLAVAGFSLLARVQLSPVFRLLEDLSEDLPIFYIPTAIVLGGTIIGSVVAILGIVELLTGRSWGEMSQKTRNLIFALLILPTIFGAVLLLSIMS